MAEIRNPPRESGDTLVMTLTQDHFNERKAFLLKPIGEAEEYIVSKLREEHRAAIADSGWARLTLRDMEDGSEHRMELTKHGNLQGGLGKEYILDDWHHFLKARNKKQPSTYHLQLGMKVTFRVRDGVLQFSAPPSSSSC
nr:hypothetical protein Iba_chr07dCG8720 [Ipomoea batatas]